MKFFSFEDVERNLPLIGVHGTDRCAGDHCIIHDPSRHNLALAPFHIVQGNDCVFMFRVCPCGKPHVDPDGAQYISSTLPGRTLMEYLGKAACPNCCGCCDLKIVIR